MAAIYPNGKSAAFLFSEAINTAQKEYLTELLCSPPIMRRNSISERSSSLFQPSKNPRIFDFLGFKAFIILFLSKKIYNSGCLLSLFMPLLSVIIVNPGIRVKVCTDIPVS